MNLLRKIGCVLVIGLIAFSCKKKEEPVAEDCTTKPAFKRTEFTLASPNYFPPFLENTVLTEEIVSLGRSLFYEKKLSGDGTQSCGSCHNQEFAFSDKKTTGIIKYEGHVSKHKIYFFEFEGFTCVYAF